MSPGLTPDLLELERQRRAAQVGIMAPGGQPTLQTPAPAMRPIGGPAPKGLGMPSPESEERHSELDRLTAPPLSAGDPLAHTRADTGRAGWEQIHNPVGRTFAGIGQAVLGGLFPGVALGLPGTTLHHQYLVRQAQKGVGEDVAERSAEARQNLEEAQAAHALSPAAERNETAFDLWRKQNPTLPVSEWLKLEASNRPEHNETAFDMWRKQHPDADVSEWLKLEASNKPEHNETAFDLWRKQNPDAEVGDWLRLEAANRPQAVSEYRDFATDYKKSHPNATAEQTVRAYSLATQKPPQVLMFPSGGGPAVNVRPGVTPPPGAETAAGVNAVNTPTMQMRNVAAQASLVHEQTPMMLAELERLKTKLGPMVGRWNEAMQGKVGMNDPDFAGLRADLLMYSSAVALMHARGRLPENLREEFDRTINNPGQDFRNLKAVITRIDDWTVKNMNAMGRPGTQTASSTPQTTGPAVGDVREYQGHQYRFKGGENKKENWEQIK